MLTKFQAHTYSFRDWILGDRYSPQTNIRLTDWYMRMPDVMIVAICMKHRPEQQREITSFFFWCMDPAVEPSSQKVQLSSRPCHRPFEWIHSALSLWQTACNGWGARFQQKAHLHPPDKVLHKEEASFLLLWARTCLEFPTHGPHKQLRSTVLLFWYSLLKIS